jgi:hypothetical protein
MLRGEVLREGGVTITDKRADDLPHILIILKPEILIPCVLGWFHRDDQCGATVVEHPNR